MSQILELYRFHLTHQIYLNIHYVMLHSLDHYNNIVECILTVYNKKGTLLRQQNFCQLQ